MLGEIITLTNKKGVAKMRKVKLFSLLLLLMFIASSCSNSNQNPYNSVIKREHPELDKIKFYNFEWLTEYSNIINMFNKDFGENTYNIYTEDTLNIGDTPIKLRHCIITGKDNNLLNWIIAQNKLYSLMMDFISIDNGKHFYLYKGYYLFQNDEEISNDIISKLNTLYFYNDSEERYEDDNENYITISTSNLIDFIYCCSEVDNRIKEEQKKARENMDKMLEEKQKKENEEKLKTNGL